MMLYYRHFNTVILLMVLTFPANANSWSPETTIDLTGIPAPYSFHSFSSVDSSGIWNVVWKYISFQTTEGESRDYSPIEEDLIAVYFINSNVGWVVGRNGTILHTQDGGLNWIQQDSGTENNLLAITCLDEKDCWTVGGPTAILHTDNGGREWKKVEIKLSESLNAVSFINKREGWAGGPDGLLVHTQDGGETWTQQQVKLPVYIDKEYLGLADLEAILFINEKQGWIGGMDWIAWTVDGGRSWSRKKIEGTIIGFVTQDGKKVWAINDAVTDLGERNYFSSNGGKSWKKWNPPKGKPKQTYPKDAT